MDDGGWLSTRNRQKVTQPQPRLKKRRSSLKPLKSTCLQTSNSPPPKQLFTATKQSSLNDFFSTGDEHQFEVEVNLDNDIHSGISEHTKLYHRYLPVTLSEKEKLSECRYKEQIGHVNENVAMSQREQIEHVSENIAMSQRGKRFEFSKMLEKGKENNSLLYPVDAFKVKVKERERLLEKYASVPSGIKLSNDEIKKEKWENEHTENISYLLNDNKCPEPGTEMEGGTNILADKGCVNRKRNPGELDCNLGPSVKRYRTTDIVSENNLELTDHSVQEYNIEYIKQCDTNEQSNTVTERITEKTQCFYEDVGSVSAYHGISQDIEVPMSCFSSQSLHLDSPILLQSQNSELETANTLVLDTQNEHLGKGFDTRDLLKLGKLGDGSGLESSEDYLSSKSLTFSSQVEGVDSVSKDISFSNGSQNETVCRKYKHFVSSASLDLSSQNDMFEIGLESTLNSDIPHELQDELQLSFTSTSVQDYQSLQLP